jgi:hypothetical protein
MKDVVAKVEVDCTPYRSTQNYTEGYDEYGNSTGVRFHSATTYTYAVSCGLDGVYTDEQNNTVSAICDKVVLSLVPNK